MLARSPDLMSAGETALLVVDVQQKLVDLIDRHGRMVWNVRRLIDGAKILGLPVLATEQYPQGLGPTVAELAERLERIGEKTAFSCRGCAGLFDQLRTAGARNVLVCGIETHVCVAQTVLDLLSEGFRTYVAVDAVAARHKIDHKTALRRLDSAGATLTTTEAALFEWCEAAGTPQFKAISTLVKERMKDEG